MRIPRCVNIDWLEVYCLEPSVDKPLNESYYNSLGILTHARQYGTRIYNEMFTIVGTDGEPLLEVRRSPKSANNLKAGLHGILSPRSCHIRLVNRSCYFDDCVTQLRVFLARHGYIFQRISRIDICLDFERFDHGDLPQRFMQRYMRGVYSKINQAKIHAHGDDTWAGRCWNSVSWGNPTSQVSTKFYCKSLELKEVKDKPYIRQQWQLAGLVDDAVSLIKFRPDGTFYEPDIWRVEFSIKSSVKNWFVIEDTERHGKPRSIRNTLAMYETKLQLYEVFLSLARHYFHFKYVETLKNDTKGISQTALDKVQVVETEHKLQRKDRCRDKVLFDYSATNTYFKVGREPATSKSDINKVINSLVIRLEQYRYSHPFPDVISACDTLIADMLKHAAVQTMSTKVMPKDEVILLQQLIAKRIKAYNTPLSDDIADIKALIAIEGDLF